MRTLVTALLVLAPLTGLTMLPAGASNDQSDARTEQSKSQAGQPAQSKPDNALEVPGPRQSGSVASAGPTANNFDIVGHHDLGADATYGDVWVHGDYAYVGTWSDPCRGSGVRIIDVSDPEQPALIGSVAARRGTSAEDVVVRSVTTPSFTGDLLAVGIQQCGINFDPFATFGVQFWDVTDPHNPSRLGGLPVTTGFGGVHELDLMQRGSAVYAALAVPYSEWFDRSRGGDIRIVNATNPRNPNQIAQWSARGAGLSKGAFHGLGSFGANYGHSARFSEDGTRILASFWDVGLVILDITTINNPVVVGQTKYARDVEGNAHSVSQYGKFLLQNDEDDDPRSPPYILFDRRKSVASEHPFSPALWRKPNHKLRARVVKADRQGCARTDYPRRTEGKIAVVRTLFPYYDPGSNPSPDCPMPQQERAARRAGAVAVVHDWISERTSPQWTSQAHSEIPVLFTRHRTANAMVEAGVATLRAQRPALGFIRIFRQRGGSQVAKFDEPPNVHRLNPPTGTWGVHNNEVLGNRSYASWYTNGIIAMDLSPLDSSPPGNPVTTGQFAPPGAPSRSESVPSNVPVVWGVAIRDSDDLLFVSDMNSGLWIVRPTGAAAPSP